MTTRDDLIRRLCEASEGSADLSRQFWVAMGAVMPAISPCVTTNLSAAWEEAERRGYCEIELGLTRGKYYAEIGDDTCGLTPATTYYKTPALALCAAILAAEGER